MKAKKLIFNVALTLILASLFCPKAFSQNTGNEITVNVNVIPPYSARLYEFSKLEEKLIVTLTNTTTTSYSVMLIGSIIGDNGTSITTKQDYQPSRPIIVPPGTKQISSSTVGFDFLDESNVDIVADSRIRNMILKDGIVPEGTYSFCIEVLDYNTRTNLSQSYPLGCAIIPIVLLQPPVITNPIDEMDIFSNFPQFAWVPVTGNIGSDIISYDLYILKLLKGQNPNDAMLQAVNYNVGNPLKKTLSMPGYVYLPSDWPLEDSATYVMQVIAKSAQNLQPIFNDGKSEVVIFRYISTTTPPPPPPPLAQALQFTCDCNITLPSGGANQSPTVNANSTFLLGEYNITISNISSQPDGNGVFSGEGTLPFPLSSGTIIPLEIDFTDIQINSSNEAISGFAVAKVNSNATFIPESGSTDDLLSLNTAQLQELKNYFTSHPNQLTANANGSAQQLPLGLNDLSNGTANTVAITGMYFTPTNASFDAAIAIDLPDATPNVAGFSRKYICLSATDVCNKPSALFLESDLTLDLITSQGNFILQGWNSNLSTPSDSGTYVLIDKNGLKNLRIQADYIFPVSQIVQTDGVSPVETKLKANATSWNNWIGTIEFEYPFVAGNLSDFSFDITQAGFFDHSDLANPSTMPNSFITADPSANTPDWTGILLPEGEISFPGQNINLTNNGPVKLNGTNIILDEQGVSVEILENNVLDITEGNISGWNFSIENLDLNLFKNSLTQGAFSGQMLLPIAHDTSFVNYSCVLSINNGALDYQFAIDARDDLKVPMWKAEMDIEESSTIDIQFNSGAFTASANLNGEMSISGTVGMLKKLKLNGVEFETLNIGTQNNAPTLSLGTFSSGDGKKKLGGFPLDIKSITAVVGSDPGIKVHTNLKLCNLISANIAETKFNIVGQQATDASRTYFEFKTGIIDSLKVSGDLSIFKVKGSLHFFEGDATFGDGFKGWLEVDIPKTVKITCNLQFGTIEEATDTFNYWYFDGMADIPNGVPLFPSLNAYGFGGGAYYHMTRTPPPSIEIANANPEDHKNPGDAPSGIRYIPDKSTLLGFKASLLFGLQERKTFNADVTLEISISENTGGIDEFFMYGNARVLQKEIKDTSKAMVKASIEVYYDVTEDIFHANMDAVLKMEAAQGQAEINIHHEPAGWYIKFGRPRPYQSIELTILNMFELTSYFQAGSMNIDAVPPIPTHVSSILAQCGISPDFYGNRMGHIISSGQGMIFGADMIFDYEGSFLIFKGELFAQAGFDFALMNIDKDCDGVTTPDSRWYAFGQLYAGIEASISIHINLLFIKTDIEVLSAGAGAVLIGGTPDPTWVNGAVGGYFSVLDGLIEGQIHFKFSYGAQCIMSTNALEDLEIISELHPDPDGNTNDLGIDIFPAIATNLKITADDFILDEIDEQGHVNSRTFRFNKENLSFQLQKGNNTILCSKIISDDSYGMTMMPQTMLEPESDFTLTVTANIDEFINGSWHRAQLEGQDFAQTKTVSFITGQGLDNLEEDDVLNTIPYGNQRTFFYADVAQGMIKTFQDMNFEHFELPELEQDYTTEFLMEFVPLGSSEGAVLEVPVTDEHQRFEFDFPTGLQPSTIYCVQFIARWTKQQTQQAILPMPFELKAIDSWTVEGQTVTRSQREINLDKLSIAANEKKLYAFYFRTSEFLGYAEKLNTLEINEAVFNITTFSNDAFKNNLAEGNNEYGMGYVYMDKDEMENPQQMVANIKQKLNLGANDQIPMLAPSEICLIGDEPFDVFDIEGYTNTIEKNGITKSVDLEPLMTLDNFNVSSWTGSIMNNIVDTLCSTGEATKLAYMSYNDKTGGYVLSREIDHPAAPPLTESEIFDGTVMNYFIPQNSSVCQDRKREIYTQATQPAGNSTGSMGYIVSNNMYAVANTGKSNSKGATTTVQHTDNINIQQHITGDPYGGGAQFSFDDNMFQQLIQPGDKMNVVNVSYRYNYQSGEGIPTIPNLLLDQSMKLINPSPELSLDFYSAVGQAFDYVQQEVGSVSNVGVGSSISASFNGQVSSSAASGNVDIGEVANIGSFSVGY
ncbi:MAG: hypothetical protein PF485_08965 [Bacteroidales bacterium]|nr:hypothetical protein [Bacteroidales bacterium]